MWTLLAGKAAVFWAPTDSNAMSRCLATLLRCSGSSCLPKSIRFIAPVPYTYGANSVSQITDAWWHPLLSEKWAPLVKNISFTNFPLEMILPGAGGPLHVRDGLAIFRLQHVGIVEPPAF